MIDIRDLICRAESLQANGFTRRAATAWRDIALHPHTPAEVSARLWDAIDAGTLAACVGATTPAEHLSGRKEQADRRAAILKMDADGVPRAEIAARLNMKREAVNKTLSRYKAAH
jgi:DNA-directed RNA polymerase specialized sigma24 family protein